MGVNVGEGVSVKVDVKVGEGVHVDVAGKKGVGDKVVVWVGVGLIISGVGLRVGEGVVIIVAVSGGSEAIMLAVAVDVGTTETFSGAIASAANPKR